MVINKVYEDYYLLEVTQCSLVEFSDISEEIPASVFRTKPCKVVAATDPYRWDFLESLEVVSTLSRQVIVLHISSTNLW
jgi:hypothetical protein